MRPQIAGGIFCMWLAATVVSASDGVIYRWVDAQGAVHAVDDLAEVPEPFQSVYAAKLREREAKNRTGGGAPPSPADVRAPAPERRPTGEGVSVERPSLIDAEAERRQQWKALVAHWRSELAAATEELVRIDERLGELRANPLLALTPPVRDEIEKAEAARAQALARLEAARRMLLSELPSRARKERVPPAWLL